MILLPVNATNVKIVRRNNFQDYDANYLAMRDAFGNYLLNGNFEITSSGTYKVDGILQVHCD